jgi:hypothetical protein
MSSRTALLTRAQKRRYYGLLLLCCLVILALPFWLSRRYGLAPDWSVLRVLKFLLAAGGGIGGGLLLVSGGGWLSGVLGRAPLSVLVGAGVLGTGLLATAVLLPTPPAGGAQRAISSGNRAVLQHPVPDTATAPTKPSENAETETPLQMDGTPSVDAPEASTGADSKPDKAQEVLGTDLKAGATESKASSSETKANAPTTPTTIPKTETTTYIPVALSGYSYSLLMPKGSVADVRTLPQLTVEMKPLGGWWQTGKGKPHLVLASRTRQQFIPGSTQHPDAEATRVVRIGKVHAMQYVVALPEGGYGVEYWLFSGDGYELCKVYDPRAFDSVRAALASKPLFRVS